MHLFWLGAHWAKILRVSSVFLFFQALSACKPSFISSVRGLAVLNLPLPSHSFITSSLKMASSNVLVALALCFGVLSASAGLYDGPALLAAHNAEKRAWGLPGDYVWGISIFLL